MILSANQLVSLKIILDPHHLGQKAQCGYDLTVKNISELLLNGGYCPKLYKDHKILPHFRSIDNFIDNEQTFYLKANTAYSVEFDQGCSLPDNVMGRIVHRSTLKRMGCTIDSGIFDPGFEVQNIGAILTTSHLPIIVEVGGRLAQFIGQFTSESCDLYNGQYQREKDVK